MKNVGGLIGASLKENNPSNIIDTSYANLFNVSNPIISKSNTNIITIQLEIKYGISNVLIFLFNSLFFFAEYSLNKYPEMIDSMAVPYVGSISKRK